MWWSGAPLARPGRPQVRHSVVVEPQEALRRTLTSATAQGASPPGGPPRAGQGPTSAGLPARWAWSLKRTSSHSSVCLE